MVSESAIVISAIILGIFLMGAISTLLSKGTRPLKFKLLLVTSLMTALAAIPLIAKFLPLVYPVYMPLMLPVLMAVPGAVFVYVDAKPNLVPSRRPSTLHFVLPVVGLSITLGYWLLPSGDRSTMFVLGELPPGLVPSFLAFATIGLILLWSLVSCVYLFLTMKRLYAFRENLKNFFSNTETYSLRWVEGVVIGLTVLWLLTVISLVADNVGFGLPLEGEAPLLVTAGLLLWLGSFPRQAHPEVALLEQQSDSEFLPHDDTMAREKYLKSALSSERKIRLSQRIRDCLSTERLYLDPNLSLKKLSDHLGATTNAVSQTLNEEIGMSFFDYIASLRAKAAKELLATTSDTVLAISLEVGFNSRSTFYKAFKKETGLTPRAYRDLHS